MTLSPDEVSERLSAALAGRLALQMSVSSLEVVEEWMDTPLTRWLDSVPLPMEMPDGQSPALVVALGSDGNLVRWSSGGDPGGVIPKLTDYLRRSGALPGDFQRVDEAGQGLEPAEVGSWIEIRPKKLITGWYFEDRMATASVRALLREGEWMEMAGTHCLRVARSVGADPVTDVVIELLGDDRDGRLAAAAGAFARMGVPFDLSSVPEGLGAALAIGARARGGAIESVSVVAAHPGAAGVSALCTAVGAPMVPALQAVERSIAARGAAVVELERAAGTGTGGTVILSYIAGASGGASLN